MRKHASGCRSAIDKSKDPGRCRLSRKSLYRPSALPLQFPPPHQHSLTHTSSLVICLASLMTRCQFMILVKDERTALRVKTSCYFVYKNYFYNNLINMSYLDFDNSFKWKAFRALTLRWMRKILSETCVLRARISLNPTLGSLTFSQTIGEF